MKIVIEKNKDSVSIDFDGKNHDLLSGLVYALCNLKERFKMDTEAILFLLEKALNKDEDDISNSKKN